MKTCLVTTAWLDNEEYKNKTIKYVNYYKNYFSDIFVIDNGSINNQLENCKVLTQLPHLPRKSHLEYPYLWRAIFSLDYFFKLGYEKVVYTDNDFYILSDTMFKWVENQSGWISPYCPKHNFPETGLQIITKDCQEYKNFVASGEFWSYNGKTMETTLPLTYIEKSLNGNRWSEFTILPKDVDFSAQTPLDWKV